MPCPERAGGGNEEALQSRHKPAKARPRKALKPKGRRAPKALSHRGAAPARETEVARLTRELSEAVERQAATADLLKAMSGSPSISRVCWTP